ncbi:BnaC09g47240D [Brassica napus]|uniref:BnaC09g47240D protein n=1 Tax=Brassica napus TaxID=3708 RepID=A0A078GA46_BRANA|nr:BnaC09g47240D [Brassica napus]
MISNGHEVGCEENLWRECGSCSGQACISVDYVFVEQSFASSLIETLKPMIRSFFGENPKESGCLSRIVTKKHFRLAHLLNDPGVQASIVYGGSTIFL